MVVKSEGFILVLNYTSHITSVSLAGIWQYILLYKCITVYNTVILTILFQQKVAVFSYTLFCISFPLATYAIIIYGCTIFTFSERNNNHALNVSKVKFDDSLFQLYTTQSQGRKDFLDNFGICSASTKSICIHSQIDCPEFKLMSMGMGVKGLWGEEKIGEWYIKKDLYLRNE